MADISKMTDDVTIFSADGATEAQVTSENRLKVDSKISAIGTGVEFPTIAPEHEAIHAGKGYSLTSGSVLTLVKNTNYDIMISTHASVLLSLRDVSVNVLRNSASGYVSMALNANIVTSNDGTQIYPFNNNRNSANTCSSTFFLQPTITNLGTSLYSYMVHTDWETYVSPSYTTPYEIVLKSGAKYVVRITNNLQQDLQFTWFLFLYEES
jgi:hypothetical protein